MPDDLITDPLPEQTMLLQSDRKMLEPFRRGIIGKDDRTMEPMILARSMVLIDSQKRALASRKDWTNGFDSPIYFLFARNEYYSVSVNWIRSSVVNACPYPVTKTNNRPAMET